MSCSLETRLPRFQGSFIRPRVAGGTFLMQISIRFPTRMNSKQARQLSCLDSANCLAIGEGVEKAFPLIVLGMTTFCPVAAEELGPEGYAARAIQFVKEGRQGEALADF